MNFEDDYKKLGLKIKELREKANLTQEQLAEQAKISLDFLGKIEVNINRPGLKTVFKLAKALKIKPNKLFEWD